MAEKNIVKVGSELVPEFNPEMLNEKYFRMLILGASYSGKSYFIKRIYKSIRKMYSKVILFTPGFNSDFYDFIYDMYDKKKNIILKTFKYFTDDFDDVIKMAQMFRDEKEEEEPMLIILDDIISNKATKNNDFMKLFASGRHSAISLIYCTQFATHEYANNNMRNNVNCVVITKPATTTCRTWIKNNLFEEAIFRENGDLSDTEIKDKVSKAYLYAFKDNYDKAIIYEGKLYKLSQI